MVNSAARLYKLEAVRGFAAFYVVLHHTISRSTELFGINVGILLRFGQEAVILFFLLSGFVINYSYKKGRDKTFSTYFFKRATRIFIPLFVVFLVSYLSVSYNQKQLVNPEIWTLIKNILMLQDWDHVKPNVLAEPYMGNTPLWSLSYEWWFYMLYFPVVSLLSTANRQAIVVFGVSIVMACLYVWSPNFLFRFLAYFGIWWAGVYLSELYMSGRHRSFKALLFPIGAMIAIAAVLFVPVLIAKQAGEGLLLGKHPVLEFRHVFFATVIVCAAVVWQRLNWFGFDFIFKPFLILAPISYVLYICHLPLMVEATYLDSVSNPIVRWFCYFVIVIVFSYLLEQVVYPRIRDAFRARVGATAGNSN